MINSSGVHFAAAYSCFFNVCQSGIVLIFIFYKVDGDTAKVRSSMHGTTFKLALSNWETWMVFTSESVTWELSSANEVQVCTFYGAILGDGGIFSRELVFVCVSTLEMATAPVLARLLGSSWGHYRHSRDFAIIHRCVIPILKVMYMSYLFAVD